MTGQSTIAARLAFNVIDENTKATLREGKAFILAEMPGILDRFYDHISKYSETLAFFGSREHMMHAKDMQLKHWTIIVDGRFDQNYENSVTKIGETHNKLNLEPRWYIGGYNFLISELVKVVARKYPSRSIEKKSELQAAFIKAALLDMDYAIAVYLDAGRRERNSLLSQLAGDFEKGVGRVYSELTGAAAGLKVTAEGLTATAQETSGQATVVAAAAEQASANVQTVAAAAEELSASVREIGGEAARSTAIAGQALEKAEESTTSVNQLSDAVRKIGDVVDLISKIAKQTNLLALNATIEAARAGEAGKGFAVVAQEVKTLAEQTAKATSEIGGQIQAVQDSTGNAVTMIANISETIRSMNEIATAIASAVEEQGTATQEIAQSVQEAAAGTKNVSSTILGVSRGTAETENASGRVLVSSDDLAGQAEQLRIEVESFLHTLRQASGDSAPQQLRAAA